MELKTTSATSDILCVSKCTLEQIAVHCTNMFKLQDLVDVQTHMNFWINESRHDCGAIWINVIHVNRYARFYFGTT